MAMCEVGGIELPDGPYMIGAGACKTPATTADWLKIAPVVSGSYTWRQRDGQSGNVLWPTTLADFRALGYGFNAYGMPNMGYTAAGDQLASLQSEQPLIVSIAGFSVNEYVLGVGAFSALTNVAAIELNFGCPNTQGEHNTIMSFDEASVRGVLREIASRFPQKPIWLKFSPYSDPNQLQRMALLVNSFATDLQLAVVTCNTFPQAFAGAGNIAPNNSLAGMSGPAMKPIALGQVWQFRDHFSADIDVIGVGGITVADDIVDFLDIGAAAVQVTSAAHWAGDPWTFTNHFFAEETAGRFFARMETS